MDQDNLIFDVANWFLNKAAMSHKKLQKLCYYAYAWYLVFANDVEALPPDATADFLVKMGSNRFQAWVHGPVCPALFEKYRDFRWCLIDRYPEDVDIPDETLTEVLRQVWEVYGGYTGEDLEYITHQESPWQKARGDLPLDAPCCTPIDEMEMYRCYSSRSARYRSAQNGEQ